MSWEEAAQQHPGSSLRALTPSLECSRQSYSESGTESHTQPEWPRTSSGMKELTTTGSTHESGASFNSLPQHREPFAPEGSRRTFWPESGPVPWRAWKQSHTLKDQDSVPWTQEEGPLWDSAFCTKALSEEALLVEQCEARKVGSGPRGLGKEASE